MDEIDVAMAITRHTGTGTFLIIKKADEYTDHARYDETPWEVPGGKVEDGDIADAAETMDEAAAHAAIRELEEETHLRGEVVRQAEPYDVEQPGKAVTFHPVLLETPEQDVTLGDSHEHVDYKWVKRSELADYLTKAEMPAFERLQV